MLSWGGSWGVVLGLGRYGVVWGRVGSCGGMLFLEARSLVRLLIGCEVSR